MSARGLIIAAPASGSGKTIFTLGLLRALQSRAIPLASAKVGPDYIDPAFHAAAGRGSCLNLDSWAMRNATIARAVASLSERAELIITEGVMGLFDGADLPEGGPCGSTADLAAMTGWPVLLLVDLKGQAASAAALVDGFRRYRPDVPLAGVLFNRLGSAAHRAMVERAMAQCCPELPILGWLPRHAALALPERHLGLVQALETPELEARMDEAAAIVERHVDLDRLIALARPGLMAPAGGPDWPIPPLGQCIAIARDEAFAFCYAGLLAGWQQAGASLSFFSPLADQAPPASADAIYLPGGYPELQAGRLASASCFLEGLRRAAAGGAWIYGECGGYMTLGQGLEDAQGVRHGMAGLLPLVTSFAKRRLQLGYRQVEQADTSPLGPLRARFRGHEFHYATITEEGAGAPLFQAEDAAGRSLGGMGRRRDRVMGSFVHLVDRV
ncbi:MAG TPA: cobyrinate a,c-diamide synthase [Rhodospirillaceae bacterium]|nr:cobyrinate a,c-diamide synthase [Rhodospirillaceae bacterium]